MVQSLGNPILTMSIRDKDEVIEYTTDPELIHEKYEHQVDIVIDGGFGGLEASTVIDCTTDKFLRSYVKAKENCSYPPRFVFALPAD